MGKRLLLADDSITIQKVVEITLADEGYELVFASNGDEALLAAQTKRPDLILADVFMPGLDGYQLCEQIRSDPAFAGVPVLLLAGTFEPFDKERAKQVGAAGWVSKPFSSQTLIDEVEHALTLAQGQAPQWKAEPSKSPAESMLNTFERAAATDFAPKGRTESSPDPSPATPAPEFETAPQFEATPQFEAAPVPEKHTEEFTAESTSTDFGAGGREDFTFADFGTDTAAVSTPAVDLPKGDTFPPPLDPDFSFTPAAEQEHTDFAAPDEPVAGLAQADFPFTAPAPEAELPADSGFAGGTDEEVDLGAELPSLDEFTAPAPAAPEFEDAGAAVEGVKPEAISPAYAAGGIIDLRAEDIVAEGRYAATPARVEARAAYLSDAELERIVERVASSVIERLATPIMEKVVWEVVPDLAESMIREEMDKIKHRAAADN